jgi:hypothetical protein
MRRLKFITYFPVLPVAPSKKILINSPVFSIANIGPGGVLLGIRGGGKLRPADI